MRKVVHHAAVEAREAQPERWECDGLVAKRNPSGTVSFDGVFVGDDATIRKAYAILLEILFPPAPSVPPSPTVPYVPRVGDVARYDDKDKTPLLIVRVNEYGTYYRPLFELKGMAINASAPSLMVYIRPATPAERVAAGLDAPSPVPPSPTVPPSDAPAAAKVPYGSIARVGEFYDPDPTPSPVAAPTPAATTSEATNPRRVVGAVVEYDGHELIVVGQEDGSFRKSTQSFVDARGAANMVASDRDRFVRWATPDECKAHGIPYVERGATTSEARPTHVRIDIYCEPKVRPVLAWHDGQPTVPSSIDGRLDPSELCYPPKGSWEPCAPPVADAAQPTHVLVDEAMCEIGGRVLPVESWLSDKCPRVRSGSMVYTLGAGAWTPATPTASPAAKPTTPAADFDEKREREAARAAYARGDDGSSVQYAACLDSFINGWLSRARSGAGR